MPALPAVANNVGPRLICSAEQLCECEKMDYTAFACRSSFSCALVLSLSAVIACDAFSSDSWFLEEDSLSVASEIDVSANCSTRPPLPHDAQQMHRRATPLGTVFPDSREA